MIKYQMLKETLQNNNIGEFTTFGILAIEQTDSKTKVVASVSDISTDEKFVEGFVQLCNECGLSLVHLGNAVDNAVNGDYQIK